MPLYAKVWDTSSPHNTGTREDGNRNAALSDWETLMPDADARDLIGPYPVVIRMGPYASPCRRIWTHGLPARRHEDGCEPGCAGNPSLPVERPLVSHGLAFSPTRIGDS